MPLGHTGERKDQTMTLDITIRATFQCWEAECLYSPRQDIGAFLVRGPSAEQVAATFLDGLKQDYGTDITFRSLTISVSKAKLYHTTRFRTPASPEKILRLARNLHRRFGIIPVV